MSHSETPTRIEHDLLGELAVPNKAYFGVHTQRALQNFKISGVPISSSPTFIRSMILVKKAAALANQELKTLSPTQASAITQACDHLLSHLDSFLQEFPTDVFQGGAGTSVNMNVNEVIANVALEQLGHQKGEYTHLHPNDHVNKCQSTNDAYPTGFRLALITRIDEYIAELERLGQSFAHKGAEFQDVLKLGRTQLQDAVPMTLGQEFEAFAINIREEIKTTRMVQSLLMEVNLGATAIGTGVNAPQGYAQSAIGHLAKLSGYPLVQAENLVEATSDTGAYTMLSGALRRTAIKISKICNDLRLLSSGPRAGFKEINLPELQAGSSIMPAKVNPVIPEVVNQVAFKIMGNDLTVALAAEGGQLQLNVMEPVIAQALFESLTLLQNAFAALREKCIDGITANRERCRAYVLDSIGIVTLLDPLLGHSVCDDIGKECARSGKTVREVVLERGLLSAETLDRVFSFENLVRPIYSAK